MFCRALAPTRTCDTNHVDIVSQQVQCNPAWVEARHVKHAELGTVVATDRQLACSVGPFVLDLLVRMHEETDEVEIVGQVTRDDAIYQPVATLDLELVDRRTGEVRSSHTTDEFGEFEMTACMSGSYGIRIGNGPCVAVWEAN